jgi:hypothetical protein
VNAAEGPGSLQARVEAMPVDDLLAVLRDSKMLKALEITNEDLLWARSDSDLLETLKITYEVLTALRDSDVLDIFLRLPRTDQASFLRLIGSTDDRELRHHRTDTLVSALEESPFGGG